MGNLQYDNCGLIVYHGEEEREREGVQEVLTGSQSGLAAAQVKRLRIVVLVPLAWQCGEEWASSGPGNWEPSGLPSGSG